MTAFVPVLRLGTDPAAEAAQPPATLGDKPELPGVECGYFVSLAVLQFSPPLTHGANDMSTMRSAFRISVNPVTKAVEPKQMYCERLDETAVCGGIYQ
jgi:hypothetical protein